MSEIEDADLFLAKRDVAGWGGLTEIQKVAALANAGDYILAYYPLRTALTDVEAERLATARYLLAWELHSNPAPMRAAAAVKLERKKLDGMEKQVEFFAGSSDPFPRVTALLAPLAPNSGGGFLLGRIRA